jgi:glycosyltransferase involved in cell wall biosynthesis
VVEALACGAPVLTSSTSALAEVAADAAITVDPLDLPAMTAALSRLGRDAGLRERLSRAGRARAEAFSWTRAARDMLDVYREAVARRAHAAGIRVRAVDTTDAVSAAARSTAEGRDGI